MIQTIIWDTFLENHILGHTRQQNWSRGQSKIYGLFLNFVAPPEEKLGCYHELGTCLGVLEKHV